MQKLDWYILKKFLVTFFFCLFLFTTITVAVDTSEKTDNFVSSGLSTIELEQFGGEDRAYRDQLFSYYGRYGAAPYF